MQKKLQIGKKKNPKFEEVEQKIAYFEARGDKRLHKIWKDVLRRLESLEDKKKAS